MRKLKITELNRISAEEFKEADKLPLVVVLDDIRSLHNIGSVFRTSDAFRIECIYLCGITATPPHPEMHKTALGAEFTVNWKYVNNAVEAVDNLKNEGYIVYSVEQAEGSIMLDELELAYAITIHKAQGSEYPAVIIPLLQGPRQLYYRNLLYTAVTRARKCVTVIGSESVFQEMIQNTNQQNRNTSLAERIREFNE